VSAQPDETWAASAALPSVTLPEIAVPPHVLVVSLTTERAQPGTAAFGALTRDLMREWLDLDPGLRRHRLELELLVEVAAGQSQLGEVAAFLAYRRRAGRLVGGAAMLSLELVDPIAGSTGQRATAMAGLLRRVAAARGLVDGLCETTTPMTASGVPATRVRFLAALPERGGGAGAEVAGVVAPVVEVCRWLYPVPGHRDLVWALAFQTTDLDLADELVAEFDQLAGSLAWVDGDGDGDGDAGVDGDA
jgi:hypothetical protein